MHRHHRPPRARSNSYAAGTTAFQRALNLGDGIFAIAMLVAWWLPVMGLVVLLLTWPLVALVTRLAPSAVRATF